MNQKETDRFVRRVQWIGRALIYSFIAGCIVFGWLMDENETALLLLIVVFSGASVGFAGWVGIRLKRRGMPGDVFAEKLASRPLRVFLVGVLLISLILKAIELYSLPRP